MLRASPSASTRGEPRPAAAPPRGRPAPRPAPFLTVAGEACRAQAEGRAAVAVVAGARAPAARPEAPAAHPAVAALRAQNTPIPARSPVRTPAAEPRAAPRSAARGRAASLFEEEREETGFVRTPGGAELRPGRVAGGSRGRFALLG